jgi:hypothetical protein
MLHGIRISSREDDMKPVSPRKMLRDFYDQSLLSPELLCLNCAHMAWQGPKKACSPERREDCLFFASDMLNWLASPPKSRLAIQTPTTVLPDMPPA